MNTTSPSPPPEHEIVHVPSVGQSGREQLRQQCYDVRRDVFHHEQGFPLDIEIDEYVSKTFTSATAVAVSPAAAVKGFLLISAVFADKTRRLSTSYSASCPLFNRLGQFAPTELLLATSLFTNWAVLPF